MKKGESINQYLLLTFLILLTVLVVLIVVRISVVPGSLQKGSNLGRLKTYVVAEDDMTSDGDYEVLKDFKVDNKNRYIVTTDKKLKTLENDGGSYINIYYAIDLDKKIAIQVEDRYIGFDGYSYKDKINYKKELSDKEAKKIEKLIKRMIENPENTQPYENASEVGMYYVITSKKHKDFKIYNRGLIEEFEDMIIK